MNWILVYEKEIDTNHLVHLTGERHNHIQTILKKGVGETVQVVVPGSGNYIFRIQSTADILTTIQKEISLPEVLRPLELQTFFSLPRPQTAKKLFHLSGAYGVNSLYFYATETKNKEYWTSPVYSKDTVSYLETGLSQTGNSRFPSVIQERTQSWKHFLKTWRGVVLVLDREGEDFCSYVKEQSERFKETLFVFGPESGWKPEDILFFKESGFQLMSLGKINLRTEFAYSALLHQIFSIRN
ncbi:RsmE family RNA methyltransferase [Leptospira vanthielii]|uniref:Ribosomal RNA small subunit methyltransferase E n=1 Tax=Leptospira vanthielii serovar Holland str. Waz Holland = ATCC 700522 TaxID=1218591 RepID=N1VY36_9LEPT|nr:RsmE family RNA methyltransferase [Leptospira vanthielii]EMY68894.1 RNA methyltransferase, RsmE family [Leptospira vanthielii serovar Holland str. Waz Holland = ATCC 700522]